MGNTKKRFLISGGGTGGHIFPAIAIANRIKREVPDAEILFIGAEDKMEMRRVPDAGYKIEGLHIYGISRDLSPRGIWKNLKLPFVLVKAQRRAKQIIRAFKPDVAIGVGGFAASGSAEQQHARKALAVRADGTAVAGSQHGQQCHFLI